MRSHRRAQHIEHLRIVNPHGQSFIHGFLERALAAFGGQHARAEHFHADHIQMLAFDIHFAHADGAFQPHERRARRSGHAMLPGPGFGNDPLFAHAFGQQALPQRIVDLVRAQMIQILALEPDPGPAQHAAEIGAVEHRARAPCIMDKQIFQLPLEGSVAQSRVKSSGQFVQARPDRFRHILAAVRAEKSPAVGFAAEGGLLAHAVLSLRKNGFLLCRFCEGDVKSGRYAAALPLPRLLPIVRPFSARRARAHLNRKQLHA